MSLIDQKKFYNDYWGKREAISYSKRKRIVAILERLTPLCRPGTQNKILDLGCGDGRSVAVWSLVGIPFGLELAPEAVKEANRFFPEFVIIEGDATNTPFEDNYFDIIVSQEVIEHIEDQEVFIRECNRILRKDGYLILTTPNKYYFDRRKGGNYSNQPIEKILRPSDLLKIINSNRFQVNEISSIIPKKGHYGIYFFLDRILSRIHFLKPIVNFIKNKYLLSAHLIVVAVNKKE